MTRTRLLGQQGRGAREAERGLEKLGLELGERFGFTLPSDPFCLEHTRWMNSKKGDSMPAARCTGSGLGLGFGEF